MNSMRLCDGMGLRISCEIIELLHGIITVRSSQRPGGSLSTVSPRKEK